MRKRFLRRDRNYIMKKYFIFIDETGNNSQDQFFGLGCLLVPVDKIGEYHELLKIRYDKILTKVKDREIHLMKKLDGDNLFNFLKGRRKEYEMKFKIINNNTEEEYKWLISQYFKFTDVKFCCLVIDKKQNPIPQGISYFDAYINNLDMLIRNNVSNDEEFVILPDDITVPKGKNYEEQLHSKLSKSSKKCFGIHRIESHSSLFLQMVDVLTGGVVYGFQDGKKDVKKSIVKKILEKIRVNNFMKNITKSAPNYFSVWVYKK